MWTDDDDEDEDEDEDEESGDDRGVRRFDEVVTLLFTRLRAEAHGRRLERLGRAEADLRRCLEANADRLLIDPELALVPLEQQLEPAGAHARVASAEVLMLLLPAFLDQPAWRGVDAEDRRLRIRLALRLAREATRLPELTAWARGCAMWDVEAAVDRGRRRLRLDRAAGTTTGAAGAAAQAESTSGP